MDKLKLYYSLISPPCRSVLMVLKTLELKNVSLQEVDILSRNYVSKLSKLNPQHTVPILQDNGFTICESHAIGPYLVTKFGSTHSLYPNNPETRAMIHQRLHFDSGILYPVLHRAMIPILFRNKFGITYSDVNDIKKCYGFLNDFLSSSKWLVGDNVTLADLSCLSTTSTLDLIYPVDSQNYPHLSLYLKRAEILPYYVDVNLTGLDRLAATIQNKMSEYEKQLQV